MVNFKPTFWKILFSLLTGIISFAFYFSKLLNRFHNQNPLNRSLSNIIFLEDYHLSLTFGFILSFLLIYFVWSCFQNIPKYDKPIEKLSIVSFVLSIFAFIPFFGSIPFLRFAFIPLLSYSPLTNLFSIVFWIYPFFAFGGIIFGIISLIKIRKENLRGKWLAIFALVISSISLIFFYFFISTMFSAFS